MNAMSRYRASACGLILAAAAAAAMACGNGTQLTELQRVRSGMVEIVLLSPSDALRHGKDTFFIELRSTEGGALIDGGNMRVQAGMMMSGVPMFGTVDVKRTDVPGRYEANADLSMAGRWRITVEWDGPPQNSVSFSGSVL